MKSIDCYLGRKIEKTNEETGNAIVEINWDDNPTFCEFQSLSYKEFYQAQSSGFKPEMNLKLSSWDYDGQEYISYEGQEYTVLKTYIVSDNPDRILITCVRGIKDVSS